MKQMINKKKYKLYYFFTFFFLAIIFYFLPYIITFGARCYLCSELENSFNQKVKIEKIRWQDNQIIFENIYSKNKDLLSIESLQLKYKWRGLKKLFSFHLHLKRPKIVLFNLENKNASKSFNRIKNFLPSLSVENGFVQLVQDKKDIFFNFSFDHKTENKKQKVYVWLDNEKNKTLDISFSYDDKKIYMDVILSHLQADFAESLFCYFQKNLPFQFIKGDINGSIALQIFNNQLSLKKFDLNAFDFVAFIPSMQLFLEGDNFKTNNKNLSCLNLENFLSFLNLDISFKDLLIRKKEGKILLSHICGKNIFNDCQKGFDLQAVAEETKEKIHFVASLENKNKWNLSCDFAESNISFHFASLENMNIEVSRLFPSHFFFLQKLFGVLIPQLEGVIWEKGSVDASLTANLKKKGLQQLLFEKINCKDIGFYKKENDLRFACDLIQGSGKIDLASPETFFCDLYILQGQIINHKKNITDLSTRLIVENGIVLPSKVTFRCNDMTGNLKIKGPLANIWGKMQIEGKMSHLFNFLMPQEKIIAAENENFILSFEINRKKDATLLICGEINVKDNEEEKLKFDFLLNKLNWKNLIGCVLKGKIEGEKIDLKRWSSFIDSPSFLLDGKINFIGEIENSKSLFKISFEKSLCYLSEKFNLEICDLQDQNIFLSYLLSKNIFSLKIPTFSGKFTLPEFKAFFSVKNADLIIDDNILTSHVRQCDCDDVSFSGDVKLNLNEKDIVNLEVGVSSFNAASKNFTKFLSHFTPDFKFCINDRGNVHGSFDLLLDLLGNKQMEYKAKIFAENLSYDISDNIKLQNLQLCCQCDSKKDLVETENVSADLIVGDEKKDFEKYCLFVPLLRKNQKGWDFDLRIEKQMWNVLRLVGGAVNNEGWQFIFEPDLCHFFGSKFYISDFSFDQENKFKHFLCELELENDQLLSHLEFLVRSQAIIIKGFKNVCFPSVAGKIQTKVEINNKKNLFLNAIAKDLQIGEKKFSQAKLVAKKVNDMIDVQEFYFDDIKANLLLKKDEKNWEIVEGRLKKQKQMSFLFNGMLSFDKNSLFCHFYDFKIDMGKLSEEFSDNFNFPVIGKIEGEGKINFLFPSKDTSFSYSSDWFFQLSHFSVFDLEIENKELVHLHCSKKKGLELNNVDLHCYHHIFHPFLINFKCNKVLFDKEKNKIHCNKSKIFIPLKVISAALGSNQLKKSGAFYEFLEFIKKPFTLEKDVALHGNVNFDWKSSSLNADLLKANITLNGQEREFKDICFSLENSNCTFDFTLPINGSFYKVCNWISITSSPFGRITIWEEEKYKDNKIVPLTLQWAWQDHDGLLVQNIQGSLSGMDVSFHLDEKMVFAEKINLLGSIKMNLNEMAKLFPDDWKKAAGLLKLGKGYELRGIISLPKKELDWFQFDGSIAGKQFEVNDFRFKTLLAQIQIQPKSVKISDFKISDRAGIIAIDKMEFFTKDFVNWTFSLPSLIAQDIRPSLIEKIDQKEEEIKPFLIRQLKLENLNGNLSDPLSVKGVGEMEFVNSFKRGVSVLDIPAEFLGRLVGLDQELLIPVKGKLEFNLIKGKIFFSNLIDAYSENNRSQFFLINDEFEPFMDFQGNMKIHIKMKQFVLFKLTENFILSIGGNIQNPDVKLHRKKGIFSFND